MKRNLELAMHVRKESGVMSESIEFICIIIFSFAVSVAVVESTKIIALDANPSAQNEQAKN